VAWNREGVLAPQKGGNNFHKSSVQFMTQTREKKFYRLFFVKCW